MEDNDNAAESQMPSTRVVGKKKRRLSRKEQKERRRKKPKNDTAVSVDDKCPMRAEETLPRIVGNNVVVVPTAAAEAATAAVEDYAATYVPTPLPSLADIKNSVPETSLGKWFPKAVKLKQQQQPQDNSSKTTSCALLLFYQYVTPAWSAERLRLVQQFLVDMSKHRPAVAGRIRVAAEGLNCTLSAMDTTAATSTPNTDSALATLHHVAMDVQRFDPVQFAHTDFKYVTGLQPDRHFCALHIIPVKELVYYGLQDATAPLVHGGTHVSAHDFHKLLAGQDLDDADDTDSNSKQKKKKPVETVVIDVRNHYEAALGRFDGQEQDATTATSASLSSAAAAAGSKATATATAVVAKYIDPKMRKSTDFCGWVADHQDTLQGKRVLLYCTGGIRCERASAHLNQVMKSGAAQVYQLQGGIERYLQAFPDGGYWRGKNFTFDKREAVSAGNTNGDGGVIRKCHGSSTKKTEPNTTATTLPECVCVVCQKPWDRYVGKKKCSTCGVPVLMCDSCMSVKSKVVSARCPLCVEQNVTVRVADVEWTNNGIKTVVAAGAADDDDDTAPKAAPSVLKWGGGHAADKKVKRKWKRTPCRFGTDCTRRDCFFAHPDKKKA